MDDTRLVTTTLARLANQDYDAVFTGGGCFLFALRLHDRFNYSLRGIRSSGDLNCWGHVWAKHNDLGVDFRGCYREEFVAALANNGCQAKIHDLPAEVVRIEVKRKGYPEDVLRALSCLADRIFDTQMRFEIARPLQK